MAAMVWLRSGVGWWESSFMTEQTDEQPKRRRRRRRGRPLSTGPYSRAAEEARSRERAERERQNILKRAVDEANVRKNKPGAGHPVKHGRYAGLRAIRSAKIRQRWEMYAKDPAILDLRARLALMLAYFDDARELIDQKLDQGGHISAAEAHELREWFDAIGKLAERIHKMLYAEQYAVTVPALIGYAANIAYAVRGAIMLLVPDPELQHELVSRIVADIRAIGLPGPGETGAGPITR